MNKVICFDMDGTLADFYSVPFWLDAIAHEETYPYRHAQPLIPFDLLAQLVACGYKLTIISWNAKGASKEYSKAIRREKLKWIERNYGNLFSEVHIVKYGTLKHGTIHEDKATLIDDDKDVRDRWKKGDTINADDTDALIEWIYNLIESEGL